MLDSTPQANEQQADTRASASAASSATAKPRTVHRTAVFALHHPTRHVHAVLERAFRLYTAAYTELLHACTTRYDVDALRGLATFALDEKTSKPRMSARTLAHRLSADPAFARTLAGVCAPLESRLRQSVKEHVAQTLMGYVALSDAHDADARRGGKPNVPSRLRATEVEHLRRRALARIVRLADDRRGEARVVADLLRTRQPEMVAIPFVGIDPRYGCGLYLHRESNTFYARLDVVASSSRHGAPLRTGGHFVDIKSGVIYTAQPQKGAPPLPSGVESFGRGKKSVLVPLEMGRWHESGLRQAPSVAFLPQRGIDPAHPLPAAPVSAKLVRRRTRRAPDAIRYELHVAFAVPVPERAQPLEGEGGAKRPILAIHRGIHTLAAAVLTDAGAHRVLAEPHLASGRELRAVQEAMERVRRVQAQRGAHVRVRDRRQSRIAQHHIHLLANAIVDAARTASTLGAQVVMEDLHSFATGHAIREMPQVRSRSRQGRLRAVLNRRQFERLRQAVDQRLEVTGLPLVRVVSAAFLSQTCLHCGHRAAENMRDPDAPRSGRTQERTFRCVRCGAIADVDVVAAANIARKLVWLQLRGEQKRAESAESERTTWDAYAGMHPLWPISPESTPAP